MLLVIVGISGAVYIQTHNIIKNEINRTNAVMLKQMQQSMDVGLNDIGILMYQVSMNDSFRRMLPWAGKYINSILFTPDYYQISETMKELTKHKSINSFVIDMYIYLKNSDMILSPNGFFNTETFYQTIKVNSGYHEGMPYNTWYENLKSVQNKKWILDRDSTNSTFRSNYNVKMLQSLPLNTDGSDATLVFILNKERFMNAINNISAMYNGWALILDNENQALFSNVPVDMPWKPDYDKLPDKTGLIYDNIGNEKVAISYIKSEKSDWMYVSIIPYRLYQEKVGYAKNIMAVGVMISVIIGMLLAYYFSRRNYYPVDELVHIIQKRYGNFRSFKYDEYSLIKEAVNTTMDENEEIRRSLSHQNSVLRSNFLHRLLKGKIESSSFIESAFKTYELKFYSDYYAVMLFYITDFSKLFQEAELKSYEEQLKLVQFIISNVVEELVTQNNTGYILEMDDMMTCLFNFREEDICDGRQVMIQIVDKARNFIKEKFDINFKVAVSNIHKTVFGIPEAYKEALDVMEYETVMENDSILVYEDIKTPMYDYYYSMEDEYQLINCIKTGDSDTAKEILCRVFENTLAENNLSIDIVKCLMFDLASTVLKAINETDIEQRNQFLKGIEFPVRLLACEKVTDIRCYMNQILKDSCTYMKQNRSSRKYDLIEETIRFIEENYTDINFSVSSIAEKFSLTPSYLARMFKEHTGKGVLEYINCCRLEKAKELLKVKQLNIKDIAAKVGYYNINAFNRMFKKNEGITPGMYKESIR